MRNWSKSVAKRKAVEDYEDEASERFLRLWLAGAEPLSVTELAVALKRAEAALEKHNARKISRNNYPSSTICRRMGAERRRWNAAPFTPFIDADGNEVTEDRRTTPDRRINNIEVQWLL